MKAEIDLDSGRKTFASGPLPELIEPSIGPELETWCRFTGNALLETTVEEGRRRWIFRCEVTQDQLIRQVVLMLGINHAKMPLLVVALPG